MHYHGVEVTWKLLCPREALPQCFTTKELLSTPLSLPLPKWSVRGAGKGCCQQWVWFFLLCPAPRLWWCHWWWGQTCSFSVCKYFKQHQGFLFCHHKSFFFFFFWLKWQIGDRYLCCFPAKCHFGSCPKSLALTTNYVIWVNWKGCLDFLILFYGMTETKNLTKL